MKVKQTIFFELFINNIRKDNKDINSDLDILDNSKENKIDDLSEKWWL